MPIQALRPSRSLPTCLAQQDRGHRVPSLAIATMAALWAAPLALSAATGPCDLYKAGNTPCVAAHSTTRALYGDYAGFLYQVRRSSDNTTKDIGVLAAGAEANGATQETFCANTTCVISKIYDQSANHNDLVKGPGGGFPVADLEANATKAKIKLNGRTVYGIYTTGAFEPSAGVGYRNNKTTGIPTGDQPEAMYMIVSGTHYNQWCCFDYGNAETNTKDNGPGTMEAVYFGKSTQWGRGSGDGPWVMADLEDGVFAGVSFAAPASNTPISTDYVMAMLKGDTKNHWALKNGNAQSGPLKTLYDGVRPTGYNPMKKEGAIVLGIGGDNSHTAEGTFFEGCIVSGYPSNATDDAVQANVVAAGYGSNVVGVAHRAPATTTANVHFDRASSTASLEYTTEHAGHVRVRLVNLQGRTVATWLDATTGSGPHSERWNAGATRSGLYTVVLEREGEAAWAGTVLIGG